MKNMSKKIIAGIMSLVMAGTLTNGLVIAADINMDSKEGSPAVVVSGDVSMHNTASIYGDVLAGGKVVIDNSDILLDGDVETKGTVNVPEYNNFDFKGTKTENTDVDTAYSLNDVSNVPAFEPSIFDGRNYKEYSYVTIANWMAWSTPEYSKAYTINSDSYFKGSLTLHEPLVIDTTLGDVYVKIDALTLNFNDNNQNNGEIKVVGDNKAYILLKTGRPGLVLNVNANKDRTVNSFGDPNKVDLYIDASNNWGAGTNNNSMISANMYVYNVNEYDTATFEGLLNGYISTNAKNVKLGNSGSTIITADAYALNAVSLSVCSSLTGDVVTSAANVTLTGGACEVTGRVFAPNADVKIHATENKGILGQLVAKNLDIFGEGRIKWDLGMVEPAMPTIAPTPAPTAEPTPEATLEPEIAEKFVNEEDPYENDLIPNNEVDTKPLVKKIKNDYAYIFGRSDTKMEPNDGMQRGEASAVLYRLLKQNNLLGTFDPSSISPSFGDINGRWDFSAIEYMTSIEVYNKDGNSKNVGPTAYITRGEAAKLFAFALGIQSSEAKSEFADLAKTDKYYEYINSLYQDGYMEGDSSEAVPAMRTGDVIKRVEFCAIYNRIIGRDDSYELVYVADCTAKDSSSASVECKAGDEAVCQYADLEIYKDDPDQGWKYEVMMRATNSFTKNKVDLSKRGNRNELDDYKA